MLRSVCAILALCVGAACSADAPAPRRPNVLLVTVDSLRADHLGCYGYERETSPRLDALAEQAVLFERAYSHAPFTPPSHASLLTSLHVPSHGVLAWEETLDVDARTLGQRFGAAGWRTGAFYNHPGLNRAELTRGFDEVQVRYFEPADATTTAFLAWVDGGTRPFAAWLHYWDVHRPYGWRDWSPAYLRDHVQRDALTLAFEEERFGRGAHRHIGRAESYYNLKPADRSRARVIGSETRPLDDADLTYLVDRYDGGVWYADQALGELVDALEARGLLEDTIVVVTADHGESLTEREACHFTHDPFLFEETLRVPLLVRLPGGERGGQRVPSIARGVDVLPTLMELCGLELTRDLQGLSLVGVIDGRGDEHRRWHFAQTQTRSAKETSARAPSGEWLEERLAITDGRSKLVCDRTAGTFQLYDLESDPGETRDLAGDPAWASRLAELRALVDQWRTSLPRARAGDGGLSDEMRALLEGIGYVDESAD